MSAEPLKGKVVAPEEWRWEEGSDPKFHRKIYSQSLQRFHDKVFGGGSNKRIFVPLCGKTLDMIFLADCGYEVVGLEFSKIGIQGFFTENNLTYTETEIKDGSVIQYKAKEKNITIFRGDLFSFNPSICGQFDGVWDRGSYVAINTSTRESYSNLMSTLLKPGGRILMEAVDYDPTKFAGPPHYTTEENLKKYFGDNFTVEILVVDKDSTPPHMKAYEMGYILRICMLTRK